LDKDIFVSIVRLTIAFRAITITMMVMIIGISEFGDLLLIYYFFSVRFVNPNIFIALFEP